MKRDTALVLLLMALTGPIVQARKSGYKLRLADGPNRRTGRLEVYIADPGFGTRKGWLPFCDDSFYDIEAQYNCNLMGYKYGRKYYSHNVSLNFVDSPNPFVVDIWCTYPEPPTPIGRRLARLEARPATATDGTHGIAHRLLRGGGGGGGALGADDSFRRRLLALDEFGEYIPYGGMMRMRQLPIPTYGKGTTSNCTVWIDRRCPAPAFLGGLECSNRALKGQVKLMPPVASPPPPPPAKDAFVRVVTMESNLCSDPANASTCGPTTEGYSRVELQVADPSDTSKTVWGPLCGFDPSLSSTYFAAVSQHVCMMWGNYPASRGRNEMPGAFLAPVVYALPSSGAIPSGGFDPSAVSAWASVPPPTAADSVYKPARLMQDDEGFTVSKTPCTTGIFVVRCRMAQDV
ncbi:hypothetical protein HYH03_005379 [Edaphochlamys debaryana]|uniref:SRCR domain-containing protein n=1 Tax=Edaphochlamys debaryana TaxID=47281 RepID=A0A836C150_9CHLO|nr:hypothetical protein HYH03_005379 [Edaphochlamys debaryana]|eukprot:KAG2496556.1 hypothetical protein HYH03_005379 [Edaphochlamys debaryana]